MVDPPSPGATALIGRDSEQNELAGLLDDYSLITLVGPGGVGKTTLATELATTATERFEGGVFVAELAGTNEDEDVAGLVARQLGANSLEALRLRSVGKPTLVVLDNCESALGASRTIALELISGDSDIRVVATSRSPLYALGERLVPIRPLSVWEDGEAEAPEAAFAAETLFLTRAAEAGARWPHSPQNLVAVRQLTRQLNGLPLAIELAAARSRALGPVEMVELLDRQLDLLVKPGGTAERHHSLRSVIETSYEPLEPHLQHFLRSVAFMATPFDLRLAHAVVGSQSSEVDSLDLISQLVDASLVDVRQTPSGKTEYLLLDSIRAFGLERLAADGERAQVGERYVDAVTAVANDIVAAALKSFSPDVLGAIADNFSHLVNAVSWCLDHDPSPARTYRMILLFFGPTGASAEIAELAKRVRQTWDEPAPLQAEAYAVMGSLTFRTGRYAEGAELASVAVAHPNATDMAKLMGRRTLGYAAAVQRDNAAAIEHIDAAVPLGLSFSAAFDREIRVSRSAMVWDAAGSPEALISLNEVLREASQESEWVIVVWACAEIARHQRLLGDIPAALASMESALAVADDSKMAWALITAHLNTAILLTLDQGWEVASPHYRQALDASVSIGDIDSCATVLRTSAGAASHNGEDERAMRLWRTIPASPGVPVPPSVFEADEQRLEKKLGRPPGGDIDGLVRNARALLGMATRADDERVSGPVTEADNGYNGDSPSGGQSAGGPVVAFGEYELDADMCELRRGGERIAMEPQVYDVLAYLVGRRGHVVTKHELLDEVWGDRFVSEGALSSRIAAARRATGDDGKRQQVIRTVHGKGFSFVADVQ
ncbi:MAG: winged helix-turn-helix domain-containing protein [Acidimicrobiales bacterium]